MLAAIKTETPREIIVKQAEMPELQADELLIKVNACGVCGSDLHAFNDSKGYEFVNKPIILGHEISGEVVQSGSEVNKQVVGKQVVVESMRYCGECENCKASRYSICENNQVIGLHFNGGMAEYVKTKEQFIREIPANLPTRIASLSEPMAVAAHTVLKAGEIKKGQSVLVQGPGIIGLFVGLICLEKGARVVLSGLDKDYETRLSKAEDLGMASHQSNKETLDEKFDILFECSGSPVAAKDGFNHLKKGGIAIFVALYEQSVNLFLTDLVRNEWPIISSYGCDPSDYEIAFEMLTKYQEKVDAIISYYELTDIEKAFDDSLKQNVLKSVLLMN